jgi:hypothetical protein
VRDEPKKPGGRRLPEWNFRQNGHHSLAPILRIRKIIVQYPGIRLLARLIVAIGLFPQLCGRRGQKTHAGTRLSA